MTTLSLQRVVFLLVTFSLAEGFSLSQFKFMDLLYGRISWATSHLTDTCDGYDVEVRYSCIHDEDLPFPTEEEFKRVCELVGLGLQVFMDQNITMDDGITYNMTLYSAIVNETDSASDHVSVTLSFACGRRPYWAFGPVHLYYCNQTSADPDLRDGAFMSDAAHEFGHGIMASSGPFLRTATHKGTSTLWQTPLEHSLLNCEDPTIDVMHYHAGLSPNCRNVTEAEVPAVLLGEEEAAALVRNSEAGARPPLCPPAAELDLSHCGGFCLTSLDCGGSCSRCECFSCAGRVS